MTSRRAWIAGLMGMALAASPARAQLPAGVGGSSALSPTAGAVTSALGGGASATPVAGAAGQNSIWGFFGISKANCQACKNALCQSQLGLMLNSMLTGPVGGISGGFIPPLCPPALSPAAIAALPGGAGGAAGVAAQIKADEADAKARVAAVEYLGTVDCNRYPEAKAALINALRVDRNECVRYAAARVLNSGCCCSKEMIDALKVCVAGTDTDGNAAETSSRVKGAAFGALQNCLMKVPDVLPEEKKPVIEREGGVPGVEPIPTEKPLNRDSPSATLTPPLTDAVAAAHFETNPRVLPYREQLRHKTFGQTVDEARRTLFEVARNTPTPTTLPPGKQSVYHALLRARQDFAPPPSVRSAPPVAPPQRDPAVAPSSYTSPAPKRVIPPAPKAKTPRPKTPMPSASSAPKSPAKRIAAKPAKAAASGSASSKPVDAKRGLIGLWFKSKDSRETQ